VTAFDTRAVHACHDPAQHNGSVTTPIYQVSTFVRPHARPVDSGWDYSRIANPTRAALEECLAALDNGASAVATSSGMAAATTVILALCRSGAHLVMPDNVYGGTWDLMHDVYQRWGLTHTAVDMGDLDAVAAAIRPETALVWTETPSNPLLKITDIAAVADLAHRAGALVVVDSTFGSPYLQQPIVLGGDLVIHSTTKYLSGHSDVTGGAVIAADEQVGDTISRHVGMLGTAAAPQEPGWCSAGSRPSRCGCGRSARAASGSPPGGVRSVPAGGRRDGQHRARVARHPGACPQSARAQSFRRPAAVTGTPPKLSGAVLPGRQGGLTATAAMAPSRAACRDGWKSPCDEPQVTCPENAGQLISLPTRSLASVQGRDIRPSFPRTTGTPTGRSGRSGPPSPAAGPARRPAALAWPRRLSRVCRGPGA
jgi:Cys/Met metabolism PLP-dependent enzyme